MVIRCGSTHLNGCQKQKSLNRAHRTHSKGETHTQQTQPDKNIISTTMETRFLVVYIIRFQFMRGDWFSTNKFYFRLKSRRNLWKTICIPTKHLVGAFFFLDSPGFEWKLILLTAFNCLFRFFSLLRFHCYRLSIERRDFYRSEKMEMMFFANVSDSLFFISVPSLYLR